MRGWLACTTALLLVPAGAAAKQLSHGVESEAFWTDNLFGSSEDEVDDTSVRVSPWAQLVDYEGDLSWNLRYSPSYEYFLSQSELSGFDHDVRGSLSWRMGPRTTLGLSDTFRRTNSVSRFNEDVEPGGDLLLQGRRNRVKSNQFSTVLQHSLNPVDFVSLSASYGLRDLSGDEATDSEFLSSGFFYQHRLSERTSIGSRVSWARQTNQPGDINSGGSSPLNDGDRNTDFYNLSGVLNHDFSRTLHLAVSAGPTLIYSDQPDPVSASATETTVARFPLRGEADGPHFIDADTCPTDKNGNHVVGSGCQSLQPALTQPQLFALFLQTNNNTLDVPIIGGIPGVDNSNSTYFADVTLTKEWQRWSGSLSYRRSQDQSSNVGAVSDIVFGRLKWLLSPRFSNSLLASYELREQATQSRAFLLTVSNQDPPLPAFPTGARSESVRAVTLSNDLSVVVLSLSWQLNYQFAERAELYSIVSYRDESPSSDAALLLGDVSRFNIRVGVRYTFDAIQF